METREPDQAREVGEEAVGPLVLEPLVLSRPEGGGIPWLFLGILTLSTFAAIKLLDAFPVDLWFNKREQDLLYTCLRFLPAFFVQWLVWRKRSKEPDLHFVIERGDEEDLPSQAPLILENDSEIQPTRDHRFLAQTLCWVGVGTCIGFLTWSEACDIKVLCAAFLVLILGYVLGPVRFWFSQLLTITNSALVVDLRELEWQQIERVEISHLLNFELSFNAVQLTFRGKDKTKIAQVTLPKDQCNEENEKLLLKFIGQVLGRRIKTIAPSTLNWI
jgi:hypothetical protein